MTNDAYQPTHETALEIANAYFGGAPEAVHRFPTGLAHWVYDVRGPAHQHIAIRISSSKQPNAFSGAIYWSEVMRPMGVPLPALLAAGRWQDFPYMILERLPGTDLGEIYAGLLPAEKRAIAAEVSRIQQIVGTLDQAAGYGYVNLPDGPYLSSWAAVVEASISRSQTRIEQVGAVKTNSPKRLKLFAVRFANYFSAIRPVPFLDDTTTKNVLVQQGALSGIVDVDHVCYGDPLLTVALTRASLLASGRDTEYTDHWSELLSLGAEQHAAIRFYTALFCLDFIGEIGYVFNNSIAQVDYEYASRLEQLIDDQLRDLLGGDA